MKSMPLMFALTYSVCLSGTTRASEGELLKQQAIDKTKQFASQLQSTLKSGIASGGPVAGIEICKTTANLIAKQHSVDGWLVGRTSLKLRNSMNQPDAWESEKLAHFEQQLAQGVAADTLAASEIVTDNNGQKHFRFIKAIPTAAVCLNCHGVDIKPEVKAVLTEHYPDDKATGYLQGQIRGAFTLSKLLE